MLSDAQRTAVEFGMNRSPKSWRRRPCPIPPFAVPAWCRDAHINWMDGWGNFPELQLRLNYDPLIASGICAVDDEDLEPMWHQPRQGVFCANADGMGSVHYHNGTISWNKERQRFQTTRQEGYSGRTFTIRMAEGEGELSGHLLDLRGPWHGGAPVGYIEVHCRLATAERDKADRAFARKYSQGRKHPCRWYNLGGFTFGWYVGEITLLNIFAHMMPEIEWADVDHGNWKRLEPIDPRTNCPKGFTPEQELKP